MQPKGNTKVHIRKWWVTLISEFYLSFFWSNVCQYLSINITICPSEKTLKYTVHFFKKTTIYKSTIPISNVKLKRVSKVSNELYNYYTV